MLTHRSDGTPYDLEDLVSTFGFRLEAISDLVEGFAGKEHAPESEKVLVRVITCIRDDWEVFENAVDAWYEREHSVASDDAAV